MWLWVTLGDPLFHCSMSMFNSVRLNWTLHDPVWICITLYDSEWLFWNSFTDIDCFLVYWSCRVWLKLILFSHLWPILTLFALFWHFSYCLIPFNCFLKFSNSVWIWLTHAVMNNFFAWNLNMFRQIQNGSKWFQLDQMI